MKFASLRTNAGRGRFEMMGGRSYYVQPAILIREMVLNGELALASEFGAFPESWDGRPVTINHPKSGKNFVSANSPTVLEQVGLGYLFNTHLDGTDLKSELWLDVAKVRQLGGDAQLALNMLEQGRPLELSTGYFCGLLPHEGVFNGVAYRGQQFGIRPDHLALLPGELGACSWAAGCGAGRFNERKVDMNEKLQQFLRANRLKAMELAGLIPALDLRVNELSQNETWSILGDALKDALGVASYNFYVEDIYDGSVVYQLYADYYDGDPTLYSRPYTIDESTLQVTFGQPQEVIRRVSYETKVETATVSANAQEGGDRAPEPPAQPEQPAEPVQAPIVPAEAPAVVEGGDPVEPAATSVVAEQTRAEVEGGGDGDEVDPEPEPEQPAETQPCGCQDTAPEGGTVSTKPADTKDKPATQPKANAEQPQTLEQYIAGIPDPKARAFIANGVKKQEQRRTDLISGLTANEACLFAEDELKGMSDDHLERLSEMLSPEDYTGRGVPRVNAERTDEEALELPSTYVQPASA